MSFIQFSKATERNSPCFELRISGVVLGISYETVISAHYGNELIRRHNVWGPTTGRHMRELGVKEYTEVDEPEFNVRVKNMVLRAIARAVKERMGG